MPNNRDGYNLSMSAPSGCIEGLLYRDDLPHYILCREHLPNQWRKIHHPTSSEVEMIHDAYMETLRRPIIVLRFGSDVMFKFVKGQVQLKMCPFRPMFLIIQKSIFFLFQL